MIYFDNAATSFPKAPGVASAMARFIEESAANPGRAGHRMAIAAERMIDDVRLKLTRFFDGQDHHRMVFAFNGTDALNMAIKGVLGSQTDGKTIHHSPRWHVITTVLEHNSVSRPLVAMQQEGRIDLTQLSCNRQGFIDPDEVRRAVRPNTKLIVMTHASNVLGTIQDAGAIGRIAREHDLLFCLDAAQTAGVVPISIEKMYIDLLAFPGHKSLLGPPGTGALYVGARCPQPAFPNEAIKSTAPDRKAGWLRPWREGGTGGDSSTPTQPTLYPYYLEGGTPNTVGIAGLGAALDYLALSPMEQRLAHEQAMIQVIRERLADAGRFTLYGPTNVAQSVGTLSINLHGYEAPDVGSILDDSFEIAVRPGLHCAPYVHRYLGTFPNGTVRISPGVFNTQEELNTLIDALIQIAG